MPSTVPSIGDLIDVPSATAKNATVSPCGFTYSAHSASTGGEYRADRTGVSVGTDVAAGVGVGDVVGARVAVGVAGAVDVGVSVWVGVAVSVAVGDGVRVAVVVGAWDRNGNLTVQLTAIVPRRSSEASVAAARMRTLSCFTAFRLLRGAETLHAAAPDAAVCASICQAYEPRDLGPLPARLGHRLRYGSQDCLHCLLCPENLGNLSF